MNWKLKITFILTTYFNYRNATSTRLFNGDLSAAGMKSISVDDQLNSLADARLPFKQASTRYS